MSKIFCLDGIQISGNHENWKVTKVLGFDEIGNIKDPDGVKSTREITSIPTPFARIDLTKSAFEEVVRMCQNNSIEKCKEILDGDTIYNKIISDSLDVAEIFFNYDRFADKFEIIYWDKSQLAELANPRISHNKKHNRVGRALDMYWQQDAKTYNFDRCNGIFLLNYIGPGRHGQLNIVGATSPCTLFFSSANNFDFISKHVAFSQDKPFDTVYTSLYRRDFEFVKYLWYLSKNTPGFSDMFKAVYGYLKIVYEVVSYEQKCDLDVISKNIQNYTGNYTAIRNSDDANNFNVSIITDDNGNNIEFHQRSSNVNFESDFEIRPTVGSFAMTNDENTIAENEKVIVPLVLPNTNGNMYTSLNYVSDKWASNFYAPNYDSDEVDDRKLPVLNVKYPYLTVGDFLSDTIVKMPFKMDTSHFWSGFHEKQPQGGSSYLLPLTETFFKYFSVDDLLDKSKKPLIKMVEGVTGGTVSVTLMIPIKGRGNIKHIEYKRVYSAAEAPDQYKNMGTITNAQIPKHSDSERFESDCIFGLGVSPIFKFPELTKPHYRIPFFNKSKMDATLSFYDDAERVGDVSHTLRRSKGGVRVCSVETYSVNSNFDRIMVELGNQIKGYIVPIFKQLQQEGRAFTFAIDFGTSNTHIEYKQDGSTPKEFDIEAGDQQMIRLHSNYAETTWGRDINGGFLDNNTPNLIGVEGCAYKFPMRTAVAIVNDSTLNHTARHLENGNIAFSYEKSINPQYNKIVTDIKWSNDSRIQCEWFFAHILLMIRNKVLSLGGDLAATKVIWFFPSSMTNNQVINITEDWEKLYAEYIGDNLAGNLKHLSESIAPYLYFCRNNEFMGNNMLTIDIGGGTTDLYYAVDASADSRKLLSSFRFAGNDIYGDGYKSDSDDISSTNAECNGFIKRYYPEILTNLNILKDTLSQKSRIESEEIGSLISTLEAIKQTQSSVDIIAFFFSLSSNTKIKSNMGDSLNVMSKFKSDAQLVYVFIIFFSAIIYHIARLMKAEGLDMPLNIAFSGNGSKSLSALSSSSKIITKYCKLIFEGVYGQKYENGSSLKDVILEPSPKVVTCKGGLFKSSNNDDIEDIHNLKRALVGVDKESVFGKSVKIDLKDRNVVKGITSEVNEFLDFIFEIDDCNDKLFNNYFGADRSIYEFVKETSKENLDRFTEVGITKLIGRNTNTANEFEIEGTLFFLPIIGMLNNLAYKIATKDNSEL